MRQVKHRQQLVAKAGDQKTEPAERSEPDVCVEQVLMQIAQPAGGEVKPHGHAGETG
ncbi:hypothetical protein D3C73_1643510 [compost metagenome]